MTKFIAVISSGRGVGRTTIALNFSLALHNLNKKVVLFDSDFSKPNVLEHLSIGHLPITIEDVFYKEQHLFDAIYKHPSGLKIIPSLTLTDYSKIADHIPNLLADYDFVIFDTPSDTSALSQVLKHSNEAIIVHSPEYSSKYVVDLRDLLKENKVVNLGIILNKSHKDSVDTIFSIPIIAKIPDHKHIKKSFELKNPLLHTHPRSNVSKNFLKLAKRFT